MGQDGNQWKHCPAEQFFPATQVSDLNGGQGRNRTTDTRIFSPPTSACTVTQRQPAWLQRRNRLDQGHASAAPRASTC
jgi:hypothetical protein